MIGLVRITAFIGGLFLLIMTAGGTLLRAEESGAYWIVTAFFDGGNDGIATPEYELWTPHGSRIHRLPPRIWGSANGTLFTEAWSPDGQWNFYTVRTSFEEMALMRMQLSGHHQEVLIGGLSWLHTHLSEMVLSPDGQWYALVVTLRENPDRSTFYIIGANDNRVREVVPFGDQVINDFYWSPDSQSLFYYGYSDSGRGFFRVGINDQKPVLISKFAIDPIFSPDGNQIMFCQGATREHKHVYIYSIAEKSLEKVTETEGEYSCGEWTNDDWLIFVEHPPNRDAIWYRIRPNGDELARLSPLKAKVWGEKLSPTEDTIYFSVELPDGYALVAVDIESLETQPLIEHDNQIGLVRRNDEWIIMLLEGDWYGLGQLTFYRLSDPTTPLGHFDNWTLEQWYELPPDNRSIIGVIVDYLTGHIENVILDLEDNEQHVIVDRQMLGYSPLIDMDWGPTGVIGVGIGMLFGSLGMAGLRFRRAR